MKKIGVATLILVSVVGIMAIVMKDKISLYFSSKETTQNTEVKSFFISEPMSAEKLSQKLFNDGIVSDYETVKSIADYKRLGVDRIALGKYEIAPKTNLKTLLNGFTINSAGNGNGEKEVNVTFNNCRDIYQVSGKVAKCINADSIDILNFLIAETTLSKYGFTQETLPSLFFPNTYKMFWDTKPENFVKRMASEYKNFWTAERKAKVKATGLKSQSEVYTIASIVYSEQMRKPEEWKTIAGLYLNRVKNRWPLQSDPTFRFCLPPEERNKQRLTTKDSQIDCPYNTYKIAGLPPGPIYVVPAQVLDAVLNYEKHNYYFMCAKPGNSGIHNFGKTLTEHNRFAKEYQAWLSKNNIR